MSELTSKQLEAVSRIVKGHSSSQVAKAIGVSARTVERWRKLPEFVAALSQIQSEASRQVKAELVTVVASISSRLDNLASKCLDILEEIIDNPEARSGDRIQAAKIILAEWQRIQNPPVPTNEISALKILVEADFYSSESLVALKKAYESFLAQSRSIFSSDR